MRRAERAVLDVLDAGGIIDSAEGEWQVKYNDARQPIPVELVRGLMERGWIFATRNAGGWTGRAIITARGRRALQLTTIRRAS